MNEERLGETNLQICRASQHRCCVYDTLLKFCCQCFFIDIIRLVDSMFRLFAGPQRRGYLKRLKKVKEAPSFMKKAMKTSSISV
jgi:hypothetical protein